MKHKVGRINFAGVLSRNAEASLGAPLHRGEENSREA